MTEFVAKKAILLLSLLLLGTVQAKPLDVEQQHIEDQHVRRERQLKMAGSTDPDVKMVANVTPATAAQPMSMTMGVPMNQMALSSVGGQLVRYPNYPGLIYPGLAPAPGLSGVPGLQTNIANNYPSYPDPNLAGSVPGFNPFGSFGYPGAAPMYGNPLPMLPNGFGPSPAVDNFQSVNHIVNMANVQGLAGGNSGIYPAPQGFGGVSPALYPAPQGFGGANPALYPAPQVNMQGLYPPSGGFLERVNMQAYAPGF